jgi:TRAP transporter TAXI family solute receptor
MKKNVLSFALVGALSVPAMASQFITIGTGGVTGTYYPTGGAVCRMVNKLKKKTGIRCSVESTGGSVVNVNTMKAGELDFGISQSDVVYQAYNGIGSKFEGQAHKNLRSVMAIYPELLAFVTRADSGINSIADMKGKKINVDVPGSGTRLTVELIMDAFGVKKSDLLLASELKSTEGPNMLKDKKIDGYFGMFGHPTANIKDASNSLPINIVPITGPIIDKLVEKYPYYASGSISGKLYKGVTKDVPTLGVKAVLVSSTNLDNTAVYVVTKAILNNFVEFKKLHPAYKYITKKSLLDGLSAPQHEGAKKAFKEAGLL